MKLDITEQNFNNSKELWRRRGINTFDVPLNSTAFTVNGNDAVCTLNLPHEDLLYSDYSAIMYWIQGDDGTTRPESRAGFCVPSSYEMNIDLEDDTSVSPLVTSTVSGDTKGLAELTIHCENSAALAAIVANTKAITFLRPMWYTGYASENELNPDVLTPENTLVVEEMTDILSMSNPTENDLMFLNGKKYLFTFDDEPFEIEYEEDVNLSPSFFEIKQRTGTENFPASNPNQSGSLLFDGKNIYSQNSYYYTVMKRMNCYIGDPVGYGPDEIDDVLNGNVEEYEEYTEALNDFISYFDTDEMMNIHLRDNGLYLISNTLKFRKSNICLIGHGSQIRMWSDSTGGLNVFANSTSAKNIENIELCDVSIYGRAIYSEGSVLFQDQGIHFYSSTSGTLEECIFPRNMTVYNVHMDGLGSGVHMTVTTTYRNIDMNWRFIDCNVSRTMFGYNFNGVKQAIVSGGSVDNSLSIDDMHHCVYVSTGSSFITVENCVLKNSTGAAIHQMNSNNKMEHNKYRNLVINNCFDGIFIANPSIDVEVEHIRGKDIGNFLFLENCSDVIVRDYVAKLLPSDTITVGSGDEEHSYSNPSHYRLFAFYYCVDALIENCIFSNEDLPSEESICPKFIDKININAGLEPSSYEDGWVENGCAVTKVTFRNCYFSQMANSYTTIGPKGSSFNIYRLLFDNCVFCANRASFNGNTVYNFSSNSDFASEYQLRNCTGFYNVLAGDVDNLAEKGYLFHRESGKLCISDNYNIITSFSVPSNKRSQNVRTGI